MAMNSAYVPIPMWKKQMCSYLFHNLLFGKNNANKLADKHKQFNNVLLGLCNIYQYQWTNASMITIITQKF